MTTLLHDLRYGVRMLLKNRGLKSNAILTLALGIGAAAPVMFMGVVLLLIFAAFVSSDVPARRATRMDPMVALKYE
jgi:putative ABC transport system permease protein